MIHDYVIISIAVLLSVMILVMIGQKLKVAYPFFFLVIAGLLASFVPGMPQIEIEPDLVFLIFLPPILFEAAWFTSWQDFHKWRRQIFSWLLVWFFSPQLWWLMFRRLLSRV